jgi:hypothetical protein
VVHVAGDRGEGVGVGGLPVPTVTDSLPVGDRAELLGVLLALLGRHVRERVAGGLPIGVGVDLAGDLAVTVDRVVVADALVRGTWL